MTCFPVMDSLTLEQRQSTGKTAALRAFPIIAGVIALAAGLGLRWFELSRRSLWFDEGYTAWVVSLPVTGIMKVIGVDTAPPLYYLLLHGWTLLLGRSEFALRSMSAVMASLSLLVVAGIALRLFKSPWARLSAVALFSVSFMQTAYAHEARFYAMMTLFAAVDFYLVLRLVNEDPGPAFRRGVPGKFQVILVATALAWAATLYVNNMMAVYLACLGAAWLILPGDRPVLKRLRDLFIVAAVAGAVYLPWVPTLLHQAKRVQSSFWPEVPDRMLLLRTLGVLIGVNEQSLSYSDWNKFVLVGDALAGAMGLACASRAGRQMALSLATFGIAPILLIYVYSHLRQSIYMERAFLPSGIVMPLLLALPIETVRTRAARIFCIMGAMWFLWLNLHSLAGHFTGEQHEDWRSASAYVAGHAGAHPGSRRLTIFAANEGELLYDYYARQSDYSPQPDMTGVPDDFFSLDPPLTLRRVRTDSDLISLRQRLDTGHYREILLVCSHSWWADSDERTLAMLLHRYFKAEDQQFPQIRVFRFVPRPD